MARIAGGMAAARRRFDWALPHLTGRVWWPFIVVWSILLAACVASTALTVPVVADHLVNPITGVQAAGFLTRRANGITIVAGATPGAMAQGLRQNDRLVSLDGHAIPKGSDALEKALSGPPGGALRFVVDGADGRRRAVTLIRNPDQYRRDLAQAWLSPVVVAFAINGVQFLFGEGVLIVGAAVLMLRRSQDRLAPWASLMMLVFLLADTRSGVTFFHLFRHPPIVPLLWHAVSYSLVAVVLATFPTGRFEPRWSLAATGLGIARAFGAIWFPYYLGDKALVLVEAVAVAAVAARYRQMPPGEGRQQIRWGFFWLAAAVLSQLAFVVCMALNGVLVGTGANYWDRVVLGFSQAGIHGFVAIGITVSLMRYRLYDADATISQSITYGAMTVSLVLIFTVTQKLIELTGQQLLGEHAGALAGAIGGTIAASTIAPLRRTTSAWTDRHFRSGLSKLRVELPPLVGDLRETMAPAELGDAILEHVTAGVRASHGALVTRDEILDARAIDQGTVRAWVAGAALPTTSALQCDRDDPVFPMRVPLMAHGEGPIGWLLLGLRPDASFYGREERKTLAEVADPVGRALAVSLKRREATARRDVIDARQEGEIGRLRDEIAGLRAELGRYFGADRAAVPAG